jgi:hypothetical protein
MTSVWTKLEDNAYRNNHELPERPRRPVLNHNAGASEIRQYADALDDYDQRLRDYRDQMVAHNTVTAALEAQFQTDLEAEYGMTGHPKAALLYHKAWERGHAYGLSEVASVYAGMVDLVI